MEKTKVLILGAGGAIAGHVITFLVKNENIYLTLFAREASKVPEVRGKNIRKVVGDVLNREQLNQAIEGQSMVYANLSGPVDKMAKEIVRAMKANQVHRLIFVTSLGIYNEVPGPFGKWSNKMIGSELVRYRQAADVIEASGLDYTILRPAWLTDNDEVDYETTQKSEPFKGTEVSRKSVGSFIAEIIQHPEREVEANVGINKPGTEGDKPSFY